MVRNKNYKVTKSHRCGCYRNAWKRGDALKVIKYFSDVDTQDDK